MLSLLPQEELGSTESCFPPNLTCLEDSCACGCWCMCVYCLMHAVGALWSNYYIVRTTAIQDHFVCR